MTKLIYAGIGPRSTPAPVMNIMAGIATDLADSGWILRSGHANGADEAFEIGAKGIQEIFLPWDGFNNKYADVDTDTGYGHYCLPQTDQMVDIARRHHPAWDKCSRGAKALLCRNIPILLGKTLDDPVTCVITWLPEDNYKGGTRHALNIASTYGIPVFDIRKTEDQNALIKFSQDQEERIAA